MADIDVSRASGRAKCRTCETLIKKGEFCLRALTGAYGSRGYTHFDCVFTSIDEKIKVELQRTAIEGKRSLL